MMTKKLSTLWIERLIWILIYGGMLVGVVGLALLRGDADAAVLGYVLLVKGGLAVGVGIGLIWWRSRQQ
jgi:hypothetical protein